MKSSIFNIFYSYTSLLPGDLGDCLDPANITDPTCIGGSASMASVMRHSQEEDGPAFHIPKLDRVSKFVQMHPEGWGANRLILHDYFGWDTFLAAPSLLLDETRLESVNLLTLDFHPTITNMVLPPTSAWSQYLEHIRIDEDTGATFIYIENDDQPGTSSAVDSMTAALKYIDHINASRGCFDKNSSSNLNSTTGTISCLIPIVYVDVDDEELNKSLLETILERSNPTPLIVSDEISYSEANDINQTSKLLNNQTLVIAVDVSGSFLSHLHVEVDLDDWVFQSFTFTSINLLDFPLEYKDDQYIQDMEYLRSLADQAMLNDPVVGISGYMPLTRTIKDTNWRMCMGGECPIGNLFSDALRWASGADFAVIASGGVRGEGWEAGQVHVSDLWSAFPFVNYICTGVMSGVSVFRLLNYSTAVATFESTYTPMGDRLLQMSGMKMTYNTQLEGSGKGRLISVDVWDDVTGGYIPLERLKMYKFATENWMCDHFDPYPSLFRDELRMEGEKPGVLEESRHVQDIVAAYLTNLSANGVAYDTSIRGSHINDTEASETMSFIQTEESCENDYFWETGTLTCTLCPGGKYVKFSERLLEFLLTPSSKDLTGRNILSNREIFNVTLAPKLIPEWIVLKGAASDLTKGATVLQPGESIAVDFEIAGLLLNRGYIRSTVSFGVLLDGYYQGCLTDIDVSFDAAVEVRSEENFNYLGWPIRVVGIMFMTFGMATSVFFFIWTHKNRNHQLVRNSQPTFLELICVGTGIVATSIIPLSIDDSIASVHGCDIACMSTPWLYFTGIGITLTALFAKIWRIHKILRHAMNMRRVVVREYHAVRPIVVVFTLNFILLLCWTLIDPLKWKRQYINNDPSNSIGYCQLEGKASVGFLSLLVLVNVGALVLACIESYRARRIGDEYTESRWIGIASLSWIQVMVVGVPVILLTRYQPVAQYFTTTALVFLICLSMLMFLFFPKVMNLRCNSRDASMVRQDRSRVFQLTGSQYSSETCQDGHREEQLMQRIHELEEIIKEKIEEA